MRVGDTMGIAGASFKTAILILAALGTATLASRAEMPARETIGPRDTGIWKTACGTEGCQMVQYASHRLGEPPLFQVAISANTKTGKEIGIVTTPLKVYLAPGILITVDGKRPFKVRYELCDENGCHAGFRLDGAILSAFRRGARAEVTVATTGDKAVVFPLMLDGFTKAYETVHGEGRP